MSSGGDTMIDGDELKDEEASTGQLGVLSFLCSNFQTTSPAHFFGNVDQCIYGSVARKSDIASIQQYVVQLSRLSFDRKECSRIILNR